MIPWKKKAIAIGLLFAANSAFASVIYYAGMLEFRQTGKPSKTIVETAYTREIDITDKKVRETCDGIIEGVRFRETYEYDHKSNLLTIKDHTGKVIASTTFSCSGEFPKLKSCRYDYAGVRETRGEDTYLPNDGIRFNATMKDTKLGITWVTNGALTPVSKEAYATAFEKIEKTPFTKP